MIARELADALGVSESTISRLLSGERQPSLELMGKIKVKLGWSVDDQADALAGGTYPAALKHNMRRAECSA